MRVAVTVSFLEIYNEQLKDLVAPQGEPPPLRIRENPLGGVFVQNLSEHRVHSSGALLRFMEAGNRLRRTGSTKMNATTSRSHSVFVIRVAQVGCSA
jgi:hypothetical protein